MKTAAAWIIGILSAALLAAAAPLASAQATARKSLALPELGNTATMPVVLRVAYVHNPRFAAFPAGRLAEVLELAAGHVREHLGVKVRFAPPVEVPIIKVFAALNPKLAALAESQRLDAAINDFALDRLARALLKDLKQEGDIDAQRRFAARYLVRPPKDASDMAFARALIETQLTLLRAWQELKGADGLPLIGTDRFNEYAFWNLIGSTPLPYEVIVTNQFVASAEWEGNSVHSAVRGGVSNGVTTQNREGRFGLLSMVSTYPFIDDSAQTVALRGGDRPTPAEANNYMALLLAHELGHQLLHLGHPFGNRQCLMTPPPVLLFRQWAASLSAQACPVGSRRVPSSRENTPGFVKFGSPDDMFR